MVLASLVNGVIALLVAWAAVHMLREKFRRRKARRTTHELIISPMSGLVLGAMFQGIVAIVQPQARYQITDVMKDVAVENDDGEEPPGGVLFHRQLKQIRNGTSVESLTVKLNQ